MPRRRESLRDPTVRAALAALPIGLAYVDRKMRFRYVNARLAERSGLAADAHVGRAVREVLPTIADVLERAIGDVFETGTAVNVEFAGDAAHPRRALATCFPVHRSRKVELVGALVLDDRRARAGDAPAALGNIESLDRESLLAQLRRTASRLEELQRITAVLAGATTREGVAGAILREAHSVLGARCSAFYFREGAQLKLAGFIREHGGALAQALPFNLDSPLGKSMRTRTPGVYPVWNDLLAEFPNFAQQYLDPPGARVFLPIGSEESVIGALIFGFDGDREFGSEDRELLVAIASQVALALQRVRLIDSERESRRVAESAERLLGAVIDNLAAGIAIAEAGSGRIIRSNPALDRMLGKPLDGTGGVGSYDTSNLRRPDGGPLSIADFPLVRALENGEEVEREELVIARTGAETVAEVGAVPVRDGDGKVSSAVATFFDVTERRRAAESEHAARLVAERAADRLSRLHALATVLGPTLELDEVARRVLAMAGEITGAGTSWLCLATTDREFVEVAYVHEATPEVAGPMRRVPIGAEVPIARAVRTGFGEWIGTQDEFRARYPGVVHGIPANQVCGAIAVIPVPGADGILGALALSFATPQRFPPEERAFLEAVGRLCGQSIDRARLHTAAARANRESEERARRARQLADVSRAFAESGADVHRALDLVVRAVCAFVADAAVVRLLSGDGARLEIAALQGDPAFVRYLHRVGVGKAVPVEMPPFDRAINEASVARLESTPPSFADRRIAEDVAVEAEYRARFPSKHLVVAPLRARGRVLGTLSVTRHAGDPFDADDVAFVEEVADRTALALENARLFRESEEANRRKDEFLAMLAHELRNPLAPMLGASALLRLPDVPSSSRDRAKAVIERQVRHMSRLVDDLLEVSRITRGKIELRRERFDLVSLAREMLSDFEEAARKAALTLDADLPAEPVPVFGDRTRIAQVFSNLLGNAFKFTPGGRAVHLRVTARDGWVDIDVRDEGVGIDQGLLARIFEPFTQADRSLARSSGGLGLGLAVVRGVVELHNGRVRADSPGPNQGATFSVSLPVEPLPATVSQVAGFEPPRGARRRILVVDDNRDAADMLRAVLESFGHEVLVEYDGVSAADQARRSRPDVVLCDLGLPGKDGFAVAREIRSNPALYGVRLIAVSGYGAEDDRRRAREAGFDAHLTKPVDVSAIARSLEPAEAR